MIKTTQEEITKAYPVLLALGKQRISVELALEMFRMTNKMAEFWAFQSQKEQEICEETGGVIGANGNVSFPDDPADPNNTDRPHLQAFREKMKELNQLKVELDAEPIRICADKRLVISGEEIRAIYPFIAVN